jgi:hypothetical protein
MLATEWTLNQPSRLSVLVAPTPDASPKVLPNNAYVCNHLHELIELPNPYRVIRPSPVVAALVANKRPSSAAD